MKFEHNAMAIRQQIEEDHELSVAAILEESLSNCWERPSLYSYTTSFLKPPKSFTTVSHEKPLRMAPSHMNTICRDVSYRAVPNKTSTNRHKAGGGPPKQQRTTVAAKDIAQSEPRKVPEYSSYITIDRSFHVQHSEVRIITRTSLHINWTSTELCDSCPLTLAYPMKAWKALQRKGSSSISNFGR